jgi:hypothetical protein
MRTISIPILNSLIFIRDSKLEDIPAIDGLSASWATASCVAISCLPDSEGRTVIAIADKMDRFPADHPLVDRPIDTPSRTVVVETVLADAVLSTNVPTSETRLRVWTNGHKATDVVTIALG